jgi:putative ABC transport system permease protein
MTELRSALRRLLARRGFLVTATATMSAGTRATPVMFSAVVGLLVRALPFPDADRLAWAWRGILLPES